MLYNDAIAKEKAVRTALTPPQPPPTVLKSVRTVVQQYESLVREAKQRRLLQDLGITQMGILRSVVADFRLWLAEVMAPKTASANSDKALAARRPRFGG